jgi:hypothetical protein
MRNLPLPSRADDRIHLNRAIRRYVSKGIVRGHDITADELNEVIAIYDRYDVDLAQPCDPLKGGNLPETLRQAIYAAYESTREGRRLQDIRSLVSKGVDLCPVCGIDPAVELDHFLPRAVFSPLAIFTHNLVPMCHACNNAKLAGFAVEAEGGFLHPYYDALPDVQFVRAQVEIKGNGLLVRFEIDLNAALPSGFADRLHSQMTTLALNERYQKELNNYISGHAISLHGSAASGGSAAVIRFLQLQARYESVQFYRNHWRPVLLHALAAHAPFVGGGFATVLPIPQDIQDDLFTPETVTPEG